MKTMIRLFTIPLLAICGSLVLQGQDAPSTPPPPVAAPPQALPAPRPPETILWDKLEASPRTQQPVRATPASPPNTVGGGGGGRAGTASGGYGGYGGGYGGYGGGYGGYGTANTPPSAGGFSDRLQRIINRGSGPVPGPSRLIIRSSAMDPKDQTALSEDLAVMAHILNKAADESIGNRPPTAMGIDVFGAPGSPGSRMLYLEDYGAVFTINVGIPLVAAKSGPEKKKEEAPSDTAWEEAKRELYGQGPGPMTVGTPVEQFSAEKVERLTDALVEAMRNAKNIRGLKPDDSITVCILGAPAAPESHGRQGAPGVPPSGGTVAVVYPDGRPPKGTIMTIRVKKSDADAFAKGSLKSDEFRKQVRVERYEDGATGGAAMGGGIGYGTGGGF